jgi:V-type H+-transporting ATPase subunit H
MILKAPNENIIPMLGNHLLPVIEMLCLRKWSDSDISDDLAFICNELTKRVADLS